MDRIKELAKYRLEKAKDDYETAKINFLHKKYSQSANRSYYAMFHAVRALLALDRFDSSKHWGIISYFNHHYIKTSLIDPKYSKMIMKAFNVRQNCDYDDYFQISIKTCKNQLDKAKVFISMIEKELEKRIVK